MKEPRSRIFAVVWSIALLTTLNSGLPNLLGWAYEASFVVTAVLAVVVFFRPSMGLFRLSAAAFLALAGAQLPALPNHRMILLFVALTILFSGGWGRTRGGAEDSEVSPRVTVTLCWLTIVLYLFAALAKLNWAYLDPATSCAAVFLGESLALHGIGSTAGLPPALAQGAMWWSLLGEVVLCMLLVPRKTRVVGIVLGVLFHLGLATDYVTYFANFSAAMLVLLIAWLPEDACRRVWEGRIFVWRVLAPGIGCILAVLPFLAAAGVISQATWFPARYVLFMIFGIALLVSLLPLMCGEGREARSGSLDVVAAPIWLIVVLAILNGLSPYLGIKTRSSFTMYSNLRIEQGYSNHLFMPASADLFGLLSDRVTITASSDEQLLKSVNSPEQQLPHIALCSYLSRMDGAPSDRSQASTVTYLRGGAQLSAVRGETLPADCPSWLARKLLFFGPVGPGSERNCRW